MSWFLKFTPATGQIWLVLIHIKVLGQVQLVIVIFQMKKAYILLGQVLKAGSDSQRVVRVVQVIVFFNLKGKKSVQSVIL